MGIAKLGPLDPFRSDAVLVYRRLRDFGPGSALEIAEACFPLTFGRDDPLYGRLIRASIRRVYDSVVWMRHQGVVISAVPGSYDYERTQFHLGPVPVDVSRVYRATSVGALIAESPIGARSEEMDVWHGKS
jgi:hypothetical protein